MLIGPRGGYLWGFIVGAYVTAIVVQRVKKPKNLVTWLTLAFASFIGGVITVYATGLVQLAIVTRLPLQTAFAVGVLPFIAGDIVKVLTASVIAVRIRNTLR